MSASGRMTHDSLLTYPSGHIATLAHHTLHLSTISFSPVISSADVICWYPSSTPHYIIYASLRNDTVVQGAKEAPFPNEETRSLRFGRKNGRIFAVKQVTLYRL